MLTNEIYFPNGRREQFNDDELEFLKKEIVHLIFNTCTTSSKCSHNIIYPTDGSTPCCQNCGKKVGIL